MQNNSVASGRGVDDALKERLEEVRDPFTRCGVHVPHAAGTLLASGGIDKRRFEVGNCERRRRRRERVERGTARRAHQEARVEVGHGCLPADRLTLVREVVVARRHSERGIAPDLAPVEAAIHGACFVAQLHLSVEPCVITGEVRVVQPAWRIAHAVEEKAVQELFGLGAEDLLEEADVPSTQVGMARMIENVTLRSMLQRIAVIVPRPPLRMRIDDGVGGVRNRADLGVRVNQELEPWVEFL